ncbi:MAG: pyruvate synthase subunit beta [Phycisphaerae bacterium]|nr:MAG: pyruvate synthase subunit beta [Planctomycetota bacterium]KAB2944551.1 MAG: pyruvate synthase subunit beta [Phycisphaerae bacterium]MBE7456024.1 pyruvate synthase subunit beta [Planctomycetia bacterium]MCK6465151.1 thiamine pyrophosphate-dependent enzyme [Phycisphaerae bacterium]MCL4717282.1 pyruvate synthase subunit beta [Phycisphaerae bacterium]
MTTCATDRHTGTDALPCAGIDPLLRAGNTNCAGCGMSIGLQLLEQALGAERRPLLAIPACCGIVTAGAFPTSAYGAPVAATTFASAAAVATGLALVGELNGEDAPVICWAGDGGTYDIGVATLSAAAERNENILYLCYDNEIYGNTGGQRSSATPEGVATSTTPRGKTERKKDIVAILAAHRIPYAATLSIAHRDDFLRKVRLALGMKGFRFLLLLSPCPTGWKSEPQESVALIDLAVRCGLFPLYEVFDGVRYRINVRPDGTSPQRYVESQRRYAGSCADPTRIESQIREQWARLDRLAAAFPADASASLAGADR